MKLLFTICGRAGSKGIKNKNLKIFLEYPLAFYTVSIIDLFINEANDMEIDIALNTDSVDLINLFKEKINSNIKIHIVERTEDLGGDFVPKVSVIANTYNVIKERLNKEYDYIIDLDITSPLRTLEDLQNLVKKRKSTDADVVFSVTESRRNPYFNMVKKTENGYERVIKSNFNARQEAPEIFDMNASMYAYTPEFLNGGESIFDSRCEIIKMFDTAVLDIDNENDFVLMEVIAKHLFSINQEMQNIKENIKEIMS